jgi:hypothetical protein
METIRDAEAQRSEIQPFIYAQNTQNIESQSFAYELQSKYGGSSYLDEERSQYDGMEVTEEEYWLKYYDMPDVNLEWNNGILEEKPMSDRLSYEMYEWFLFLFKEYLKSFNEGITIGLELGFRLVTKHGISIRKPDLAFIHKDNPVQLKPLERTYRGCFDICFEFLSDSNKKAVERDTVVKKQIYEGAGVKEYYILDRLGNETAFYYLNRNGVYQNIKLSKSGIIRSKVLKNFQFRLQDLYARPFLDTLIDDRVYRNYVRLDYQIEKQRADSKESEVEMLRKEAEMLRKEAETQRKEAETQRKETEMQRKEAKVQRKRADSLGQELYDLKQRYGIL